MTELIESIEQVSADLFSRGQRLLLGVSGGVDSMVLLRVLHQLAPDHGWRLTVAHLNHQLRGRSSDADQKLVERVSGELALPILVERADVRVLARRQKLSIEMAARQARHEFLARAARQHGGKTIVLAHHADDQVELFFLRLFRGAGADGLSGMEPVAVSPIDPKVKIVRPFLSFTRSQIEEYARRERIPFREDASNRSVDHLRNRIRHELLPLLQRNFQPAIREVVLRTMELLSADAEFSWHAALEWLARQPADFDSLHVAVQRRVLQDQLIELGIPPDFFLIEWLRGHAEKPCSIASGKEVWRDDAGRIRVSKHSWPEFDLNSVRLDLNAKRARVLFDEVEVFWAIKGRTGRLPVSSVAGLERFDADAVGERVTLRHWQKGDRFQPIGLPSAVKLQDLFANAKIPKQERHKRMVAAGSNDEIFWVEGLRISERFKLRPETRRVLEWKWRRVGKS